jgi:hypothetical protein
MLLFFVIFNLLISFFKGDDKLVFVMIHFRHGARSPTSKGNIDEVGEKWETLNELTGIGKRMHYILGLRNRIRYITEGKLLSEKYTPNELEIYTSKVDRTIMSIHSHLQGLYPQSEKLGDYLTEEQLEMANPPVNVNYPRIQEEYSYLQNDALPSRMTVISFTTIDTDGEGVNMYSTACSNQRRGPQGQPSE